jgi:hypothetical protein
MRYLIITAIEPVSENKNNPSSLINNIITSLKNLGVDIDVNHIPKSHYILYIKLLQLGITPTKKLSINENYDRIILYPYWTVNLINIKFPEKTIIIMPDLPSLVFSRLGYNAETLIKKIKYSLSSLLIKYTFEFFKLRNFKKIYFVGITDLLCYENFGGNNGKYLTHPTSYSYAENIINKPLKILISGAGGKKYYGNLCEEIIESHLKSNLSSIPIHVTGMSNKYLYDKYKDAPDERSRINFKINFNIFKIENLDEYERTFFELISKEFKYSKSKNLI